jgi:hypothetical protein
VTEGTASKASHFDDDEMRYMRRGVLKTPLDDDEMLRALRREAMRISLVEAMRLSRVEAMRLSLVEAMRLSRVEAMRISLVEAMRLSCVEAMRLSRVSCVSHASHSQTQLAESPETRGVLRREALIEGRADDVAWR